ncbi:MAG TPA: sensor histidine kinase [Streptosporangiaceae bacterium]|nr:sensor histidine kinase [Streptosporangiaceae bacterium]
MSSGPVRTVRAAITAGVTHPPAPRPRWLRRGPFDFVAIADVIIAIIAFATTNSALGNQNAQHGHAHSPVEILGISFLLCAPLLLRDRFPLTAWSFSAAVMLLVSRLIPPNTLGTPAYIPAGVLVYGLCLYAVAVRCEAWVVVTAGVVTGIGAVFINPATSAAAIILTVVLLLAAAFIRTRRSGREQLAVAERRHEGERALLEERQRIARELHDVVAHHMSVIAIQAEAAPYKTADPPAELVESFAEIRASALTGLNELRRVLGVLRSEKPDVAPQPGLDDLASMLETARNGGVTVTSGVSGTPRPLPDGVDLSAYRIVQEALSNAMRHAPGSAVQVHLYYGEAALVIEVRNDAGAPGSLAAWEQPDADGHSYNGGHGIIGMRERAVMLGGHLEARPTGTGEFLVTAALPLGEGTEGEDAEGEGPVRKDAEGAS